jgi:hypothetical protein
VLVVALAYFAKKTRSEALHQLAEFSKLIFTLYCITYLFTWEPSLRAKARTPFHRDLIGYILMPLVAGLIFYAFTKTLDMVMPDLLIAQSR